MSQVKVGKIVKTFVKYFKICRSLARGKRYTTIRIRDFRTLGITKFRANGPVWLPSKIPAQQLKLRKLSRKKVPHLANFPLVHV